jgi:hypothetical protein
MEYDDPPKKYNSITYTVNYDKLYESSIQWNPPKGLKDMEDQIETLLEKIVELSDYKDAKQIIDTIRKMP